MHITGVVQKGAGRGKGMGFPTANLKLSEEIPQGIYVSQTTIDGTIYPSITFVGNATTFNEEKIAVETHILNFDKDLYGKEISVELLEKIRDNQKFESVEKLVEQMEEDKKKAKEYHNV